MLNCFSKKEKKRRKRQDEHDRAQQQQLSKVASSTASSSPGTLGKSFSDATSTNLSGLHDDNALNDNNSLPTMDSEYNRVSDWAGSISEACGTIGSQSQALTNFTGGLDSAFGSMAPPSSSPFGAATGSSSAGGDSAEKMMYQDIFHSYNNNNAASKTHTTQINTMALPPRRLSLKEEMLEINAPAGKLGIVIDTPEMSDVPEVHAIKDSCPIRGQVQVGDKLVAVDDIDVREYSATEVSRLISKKSDQTGRKLTIIRSIRENGRY